MLVLLYILYNIIILKNKNKNNNLFIIIVIIITFFLFFIKNQKIKCYLKKKILYIIIYNNK